MDKHLEKIRKCYNPIRSQLSKKLSKDETSVGDPRENVSVVTEFFRWIIDRKNIFVGAQTFPSSAVYLVLDLSYHLLRTAFGCTRTVFLLQCKAIMYFDLKIQL